MINVILSLAMAASFALFYGAWKLSQTIGWGQKSWLMIIAAAVILANVAIWSIPDKNGNSLADVKTKS
jgi:surface polysaccharide O-acyltransferase-like enzyme